MIMSASMGVTVSAKIRVPSGETQQKNNAVTKATPDSDLGSATRSTKSEQQRDPDYDSSTGGTFHEWFVKNWDEGAQLEQTLKDSIAKEDSATREPSQEPARATGAKIYGIPLSSLSFASLTSQEYFAKIENRFQRLLKFYGGTQRILSKSLAVLWKTTNDVVRYKFPVGIVSAWSAVVVARKILKIKDRRRQKKNKDENERDNSEITDTYRYILRHTGRALDLDVDDLTSYRHLGGIEQVRSRLLRSVFVRPNNVEQENEQETEKEELVEALLETLTLEFVPGSSHSEYIRNMIPSFSRAEDYAHKLRLLQGSEREEIFEERLGQHRQSWHEERINADDETKLIAMALQTAEVRILDSKLRCIRDRLIRSAYRLNRTVKYWKFKVDSEKLTSSLTVTSYWARFALTSTPIQSLKLRLAQLFTFQSGGKGSTSKNPNFVHNSLLEGDRLRLAFAEAAYNAEVVRLGKILQLLAKRPEEMPDSTLTSALVEQQREQTRKKEETSAKQTLDNMLSSKPPESEGDAEVANKIPDPIRRIRNLAAATKDRIAKNLDRNQPTNNPSVTEKKKNVSTLLQQCKKLCSKPIKQWQEYWKQPRRNRFLAIRFNADGRGKFSVQTYDLGSVAIESDTAKRMLLRNYEDYQKPWLEKSNAWALEARGLIVDTIRETVQASINTMGNTISINGRSGSGFTPNNIDSEERATKELDNLETTWRVRKYADPLHNLSQDETQQVIFSSRWNSTLIPALISAKLAPPPPNSSVQQRQWMFLYQMSRDINRLKRVGEGKSLKFKWKEVHWIHWLMQWNLAGLPSAALKIWAAMWIHEQSKPYVPKVQEISKEAYAATLEILTTRFWTPFKDLVEELTSRKQKLVTGVSLAEEEASLDIMLQDLELGDGTPATRHEATIKATRQYESYMRSGLMLHALGGRLARLMLIQVQQLKVSMLDAAETIDVLFQSNKINMQLLAVIPAVGIFFVGAKVFVRFLFSVRAKDLRPITSVHADMTDYLNQLESNIILSKGVVASNSSNSSDSKSIADDVEEKQKQLGEFALTLYNYLLLLDYSSPQPFSSRQCDVIHQSLTTFLGKNGSFRHGVTAEDQSRLLDNIQLKHQELAKFL